MAAEIKENRFRNIKFRQFQHDEIEALRDELAIERKNAGLGLADAATEAVTFYREHRKKLGVSK
jgi:hypothetical protein